MHSASAFVAMALAILQDTWPEAAVLTAAVLTTAVQAASLANAATAPDAQRHPVHLRALVQARLVPVRRAQVLPAPASQPQQRRASPAPVAAAVRHHRAASPATARRAPHLPAASAAAAVARKASRRPAKYDLREGALPRTGERHLLATPHLDTLRAHLPG